MSLIEKSSGNLLRTLENKLMKLDAQSTEVGRLFTAYGRAKDVEMSLYSGAVMAHWRAPLTHVAEPPYAHSGAEAVIGMHLSSRGVPAVHIIHTSGVPVH
eukprot:scaffold273329_cov30-Tisochrysis_lutea.AAC.2